MDNDQYTEFIRDVSLAEIERAAHVIRGKSHADSNCVHLAKAMPEYLKRTPSSTYKE